MTLRETIRIVFEGCCTIGPFIIIPGLLWLWVSWRLGYLVQKYEELPLRKIVYSERRPDDPLPQSLEQQARELQTQGFAWVGTASEQYPTVKSQLKEPALLFCQVPAGVIVGICWRTGRKWAGLSTIFEDDTALFTYFRMSRQIIPIFLDGPKIHIQRTHRDLSTALSMHTNRIAEISAEHGPPVVLRSLEDWRTHDIILFPTVRQGLYKTLPKLFAAGSLYFLVMAAMLMIALIIGADDVRENTFGPAPALVGIGASLVALGHIAVQYMQFRHLPAPTAEPPGKSI